MEDKTTVAPLFLLYFLPHGRLVIPSSLEIHKKIKVTNSHDFHLSANKIVEWKWLSNSDIKPWTPENSQEYLLCSDQSQ